jgi:N-acylneuraminate cytidylyltransferase
MMKTIAVIPARGGSKGIPRKNIRPLGGRPLIAYTIEAALGSRLTRVVVSTEDAEISEISSKLGAEVVARPAELAQDETATLPVLQHAVSQAGGDFEAVMTLQPTSPFRTSGHIDESIARLAKHPEADSLVSVTRIPHSMIPESAMVLDGSGYLKPCANSESAPLRRQEKPVYYARNGAAIYITRAERLKDFIWGGRTLPYPMGKLESLDIDDLEDWALAEALLAARLK